MEHIFFLTSTILLRLVQHVVPFVSVKDRCLKGTLQRGADLRQAGGQRVAAADDPSAHLQA